MLKRLCLLAALLIPSSALAQTAQLSAGQLWANDTANTRTARAASPSPWLDQAFNTNQGSVLNRGASVWSSTRTPVLGLAGTAVGTLGFENATSGRVTFSPVAGALGSQTINIPAASGTLGISGTSPVTMSAAGAVGCATCVTSSGGGAITGTAPVAVSAGGNISITGAAGQVLAGASPAFTATPTLGVAGATLGSVAFANVTSGTVTIQPVTGALGSSILSLPAATDTLMGKATVDIVTNKTFDTAGTGNVFKINGTGITAISPAVATVVGNTRTINTTAPITGAGDLSADRTIACATCATTTNGGALSGTAPIAISAAGVISITSPLPVANGGTNCSVASGTCLDNITGFSANGGLYRIGAGSYAARTITGTANEITVTNGDGVAGNPTLSLPASLTFTGKTVTGGTFASPTFSGTVAGAATIPNSVLANSSITIGGASTSLGGTITATTILDSISSTQGTVLYRNASTWVALAVGTDGQFLTTHGAAANPTWSSGGAGTGTVTSVTPGGGLVSSLTASCSQSAITASGTLSGAECTNAQT
jgi:hypothetical protein